jgi:uncharacterized membrane protein
MILSPADVHAEEFIANLALWFKLEAISALVGLGVSLATWRLSIHVPPLVVTFAEARLNLARYLAIALEFQLGADILSTAAAPTWDAIGKPSAVAVIRTALNYFLCRDLQEHGASKA